MYILDRCVDLYILFFHHVLHNIITFQYIKFSSKHFGQIYKQNIYTKNQDLRTLQIDEKSGSSYRLRNFIEEYIDSFFINMI